MQKTMKSLHVYRFGVFDGSFSFLKRYQELKMSLVESCINLVKAIPFAAD